MGRLANPGVYHDVRHGTPGVRAYDGNFTTANTGAPTSVQGQGFTVARTGVGTFVVTFARCFRVRLAAHAQAIAADRIVAVTAFTPGSRAAGASMTLVVQSAINTPVETTGLVVMFSAIFQNVVNHNGR